MIQLVITSNRIVAKTGIFIEKEYSPSGNRDHAYKGKTE